MNSNVLIVMTDQHRADCLGCYGHPNIVSPHLDELAAEGVRFDCAYSACPSCIPARASFMTGMSQWRTGILGMGEGQKAMRDDYRHTLPGELAKAGYHTQLVGKMHFTPMRALNGFQNTVLDEHHGRTDYNIWLEANAPKGSNSNDCGIEWNSLLGRPWNLPEYLHPTHWTAMESINFLEKRDPNKPFFLCTSFIRPHSPYDPPKFFWDMYNNSELNEPVQSDWSEIFALHPNAKKNRTDAWCGKKTHDEIHRARAGYYGCVTHIDYELGALFRYMKFNGLWDNTIVIFTSDHGDMLGDHNLWRKCYAYEASARVPMIVKYPASYSVVPGSSVNNPVELRDIMPTLLDALDLSIPPTVDGLSLLPICRDKNAQWREYIHGEHCACYSPELEMQYISNGKRKYIWFTRTGKEQFFNLEKDPHEQNNLTQKQEFSDELSYFRQSLINELSKRNCGIVEKNKLVVQSKSMISSFRDKLF